MLIPIENYPKIDEWKAWIEDNKEWLKTHNISDVQETQRPLTDLDKEAIFLAQNFIEITDENDFREREKLVRLESQPLLPFKTSIQKYYYCKNLIDNKCSVYGQRPYICSGYPEYKLHKRMNPNPLINSVDCGYYLNTDPPEKLKSEDSRFMALKAITNET